MKQDTADLGLDYREFDVEHIPLPLSQRVLMPTVLLRRKGGDCEAVLGSYIRVMNKPPVFAGRGIKYLPRACHESSI